MCRPVCDVPPSASCINLQACICLHSLVGIANQQTGCLVSCSSYLSRVTHGQESQLEISHTRTCVSQSSRRRGVLSCRMLERCCQSSQSLLPSSTQPWRNMRLQVCDMPHLVYCGFWSRASYADLSSNLCCTVCLHSGMPHHVWMCKTPRRCISQIRTDIQVCTELQLFSI